MKVIKIMCKVGIKINQFNTLFQSFDVFSSVVQRRKYSELRTTFKCVGASKRLSETVHGLNVYPSGVTCTALFLLGKLTIVKWMSGTHGYVADNKKKRKIMLTCENCIVHVKEHHIS